MTPDLAYPSGLARITSGFKLGDLVRLCPRSELIRGKDLQVLGLALHASEVEPGFVFFAVPGTKQDGASFAPQAVGRGAAAIVAAHPLSLPVPVIVVEDVRAAAADAAKAFYRDPSAALPVVGVTGTNGKTTVAWLLKQILDQDGRTTGLLATIGHSVGGRLLPARETTPDAIRVQGYLRAMLDHRQSAAAMEVSSHALTQDRVRGVRFAAAVITNFSQDHLDYHRTMEAYREAKLSLFRSLAPGATAVIPTDDQVGIRAREALGPGVKVVTFGLSSQADFSAKVRKSSLEGSDLELSAPEGKVRLLLPLIGQHNVRNALAAAAAAHALGQGSLAIALALERCKAARGRLESVGGAPFQVLLDYAHTPDALLQVCRALRPLTRGRLLVLFGCGGNRDRTKRPLMGKAVAAAADLAVITSDNPRSEDPEAILDEIETGFTDAGRSCRLLRESDRARAIALILAEAESGDVVLLAGKGHETYQVLQDSVVPFDDRAVAEEVLCSRFP